MRAESENKKNITMDKQNTQQPEATHESVMQGTQGTQDTARAAQVEQQRSEKQPTPSEAQGKPHKLRGRLFTKENAAEMARRSNEAQARKKRRGEILQKLLDGKSNDPATLRECERLGLDPEEMTNEASVCVAMLRMARSGDSKGAPKAAEWIAKVSGMLVERHELTGADGAPLVPSQPLTPEEAREYLRQLENDN